MNVQSKVPNYVIQPAPIPTLPVAGTDQVFPIRRIYCACWYAGSRTSSLAMASTP